MDTQSLITEAKARFSHNSAKHYLQEKYSSKLLIAEQGGLWKVDTHIISFLNSFTTDKLIVLDTYNNPVEVDRALLLEKLITVYSSVMSEYYNEWQELESKR